MTPTWRTANAAYKRKNGISSFPYFHLIFDLIHLIAFTISQELKKIIRRGYRENG